MAATTAHVLHARSQATAQPAGIPAAGSATPAKYLVLLVLDGARPDYFGLTSLPHMDALAAAGTQFTNAFDGILESETPSGHTAIATGSRPDSNGILGFDWGNDDSRYSLFNPDKMDSVLQIMQDSHAPTLGSLYKEKFPRAKVVALSGHKYYAAAPLGGPSADAIIYYQGDPNGRYVPVAVPGHTPPANVMTGPGLIDPTTNLPVGEEDHLATRMAVSVINKMQPRMLLINYPEFDWPLGHVDGGNLDSAKVTTMMQDFDQDLGKLEDAYRAAGILDQTLFVVTADHGMMPVSRFIPSTIVDNAISRAGTTSLDTASSTADYIWLADNSKAQAVANNIAAAKDPGIASVYYASTVNGTTQYVPASTNPSPGMDAADRYLLSGMLNGHEPSVVAFGTEGSTFSDPSTNWKADHGGDSWQAQHMPLFMTGPGVRSGVVSTAPVQLEDIAPTVLSAMGVTPTGMSGNELTDALVQSTPAAQKARDAEKAQMQPIVKALGSQG